MKQNTGERKLAIPQLAPCTQVSMSTQWSKRQYAIVAIAVFVALAVGYLLGQKSNEPTVITTPFKLGEHITVSYPDGPEFKQDTKDGVKVVQPTKRVRLRVDRVGEQMKLDPNRHQIWSFRTEHSDGTSTIITATQD